MNLKNLNLTELTSDDIHPQVRANFQFLKDWSQQVTAALKTKTAARGVTTTAPTVTVKNKLTVQHNSGTVGVQQGINFMDRAGLTWSIVNNPIQFRVDISATVAPSTGGRTFAFFTG